ncbi:MAG: ROK family protein [Chitinophagales bacterium]|nr:ROK family protein [Chitinophagales bacterium]
MSEKIVAGIDIGGTNTKYGLVDEYGKILTRGSLHTPDYADAFDFAKTLSDIILKETEKLPGSDLHGFGVGSPNGNYFTGTIEFAPNLPWKGVVPLAKYFREASGLPVSITNDAKAAAMGEMIFGGARNIRHFFFITLGTGLGSGIVSDGKIVYGHDGFAGEMGHMIVKAGSNRLCGCGRHGCLETYASATGIRKSYMKFLAEKDQRAPIDPEQIDSAFIYNQAKKGDAAALMAFDYTGEILGLALANAVTLFSPEVIFLFGGLARAGDLIFNPTIKSFDENILKIYKGKVRIIPSSLNEGDAAILGAASLVWHDLKNVAK